MVRGKAGKTTETLATTSSRFTTGTIGMLVTCGAIAEPTVEHSGQI